MSASVRPHGSSSSDLAVARDWISGSISFIRFRCLQDAVTQGGQRGADLRQPLSLYGTADHAGAFRQYIDDFAPGVDQHGVAPGAAAIRMAAALRSEERRVGNGGTSG